MSQTALQVLDANGDPTNPNEWSFATRHLGNAEFAEIANAARARGKVLERDGMALFALGTAIRLVAVNGFSTPGADTGVLEVLRAVTTTELDHADAKPLALGALPFDRSSAAELTVPSVVAIEHEHRRLLLVVALPGELGELLGTPIGVLEAADEDSAPPDHFELTSVQTHERFKELVAEAVAAIADGEFQKVVVAREVEVQGNRPFAPRDLLGRLRALYPSCVAFSLDNFVGASPELLCRTSGPTVTSHPLAGTIARSGDPEEDERLAKGLLASPKERSEHGIVVKAIVAGLDGLAANVSASASPHLLELRNVVHLATTITGELVEPRPGALQVAMALHPTPAVGGWPRDQALSWLDNHEKLARDRYAGPLGYMDANGDGEWWLGIRSALMDGNSLRLLAGVGIVADSEPAAELAETQLKLQALLAAAVRP
jgi:menaquinone-specific isochorismate synthase